MARKKQKNINTGALLLMVCGLLTIALIIGSVFFPNEIFGIFLK